jgi:glycerol-3-phosphate dehydrogenase (NAD(P)+)
MQVTVIGAGSWGTTVASMVAARTPTRLWARRAEMAETIAREHRNPEYLDGHELHPDLQATSDLEEALAGADAVLVGVPSQGFRETLRAMAPHVPDGVPVVSLTKGLEAGTHKRMTELIAEELPAARPGVLAGPNLAKEVLQGFAAAAVVVLPDLADARRLAAVLRSRLFRVYVGEDAVGVELCGAGKNVIAIAAGMADGLGTGDNTRALTISRGVAELTRLGLAMGGQARTFAGLAGMGDIMATCISPLSRNRTVGVEIGRGRTVQEVIASMKQVAEGVKTAGAVMALAREHDVEMPICAEVDAVVNRGRTAREAFRGLLRTEPGHEHEAG